MCVSNEKPSNRSINRYTHKNGYEYCPYDINHPRN